MKCPHCGSQNPDNAVFCSQCSGWILTEVKQETRAPRKAARPLPLWAKLTIVGIPALAWSVITACLLASLSKPQATTPPALSSTPSWTISTTPPTILPPMTSIPPEISPPLQPETDYILLQQDLGIYSVFGKYQLLANGVNITQGQVLAANARIQCSLDATAATITTKYGSPILYRNGETHSIPSVTNYVLSADGSALVYSTDQHIILLDTQTLESTCIYENTDENVTLSGAYLAVSANGSAVTFSFTDVEYDGYYTYIPSSIYLYQNGQTRELLSNTQFPMPGRHMQVLSISDDGGFFYLQFQDNQYFALNSQGQLLPLGPTLDGSGSSAPYISADGKQLLFYQTDGTYLSENGQQAVKISSQILRPLVPQQAICIDQTNYRLFYIFPHNDFRQALFVKSASATGAETVILRFEGPDDLLPIASNIREYILDPSGRYLYYINQDNALYRKDLWYDSNLYMASNVDTYVATPDNSRIFCISQNKLLSYLPGDLQPRYLMDAVVTDLFVAADNTLHFAMAGRYFSCVPGSLPIERYTDVEFCIVSGYGCIFVQTGRDAYLYSPNEHTWIQLA